MVPSASVTPATSATSALSTATSSGATPSETWIDRPGGAVASSTASPGFRYDSSAGVAPSSAATLSTVSPARTWYSTSALGKAAATSDSEAGAVTLYDQPASASFAAW